MVRKNILFLYLISYSIAIGTTMFHMEYFDQMGSHKFSQNALTVMPMSKIPARGV